jgi:hypothetical protein
MRTVVIAWSVIIAGGIAAGAWQAWRVLSGKYDLIIDERERSLELPLTRGRRERLRVPFQSIEGISVERFQNPSRSNSNGYSYVPVLRYMDGARKSAGLAEWYEPEKAEGFVLWLRQKLQVASP